MVRFLTVNGEYAYVQISLILILFLMVRVHIVPRVNFILNNQDHANLVYLAKFMIILKNNVFATKQSTCIGMAINAKYVNIHNIGIILH